jgi:SAM-dependent methyltransferase
VSRLVRRLFPPFALRLARGVRSRARRLLRPARGTFDLRPASEIWGLDRGTPIDLFYIDRFLSAHAADITGRTLETGDARYARKFGRGVSRSDVLHLAPGNPQATIVGDLVTGEGIPEDAFDCIVLTNTLLLIYDVRAAIRTCHRALRAGGVLLAHFSGLVRSQTSAVPWGPQGWEGEADHWRFTSASARRLCAEVFGDERTSVASYGNVRTAAAALYGLAVEELEPGSFDIDDPRYEVVIGVRAQRASLG